MGIALAVVPMAGANGKTPVSVELVIAVDTSMSVDGFEFSLLMNGIAHAFQNPDIIDLIGQHSGVAVTLFQWSSAVDDRYMIPWRQLTGPASIAAVAATVETTARDPSRIFTGFGGAINFAVRLIADNEFEGRLKKIDVSGDGHSNVGGAPAGPRPGSGGQLSPWG